MTTLEKSVRTIAGKPRSHLIMMALAVIIGVFGATTIIESALNSSPSSATGLTQLMTGTFKDQSGTPIGCSGWCYIDAWNNDGSATGEIDSSGNFSFYVPAGTVNVRLGNGGYGFFLRSDRPNTPPQPSWVGLSPTVTWTSSDGPLNFKMPNTIAVTVHVTSGGQPAVGASVGSPTQLQSASTELVAARGATPAVNANFQFTPGGGTTDANGNATVIVYGTSAQTFTIDASQTVNGVALSASATNVATTTGTVNIALPPPPQLLTGTFKDQSGTPIGCSGWCYIDAWNNDGSATGEIDSSGNFSFYVPAGTVNVRLGNGGYGFFLRSDRPNTPPQPSWVGLSPTVTWTSSDGPLNFKMPNVVPIIVHVTANGAPVAGMSVSSPTQLQSASTELVAARGATPAVNASFQFYPGGGITDANGDALVLVYGTSGQTFTINASGTFNNVSLTGSMTGVPADGQSHSIAFTVPGSLNYAGEYANAPYLTSLAVRNAANSTPITYQPSFSSLNSVYTAATVEAGTTSVDIDAVTADPNAVITTYGDSSLSVGTNLVTVQIADPSSGSARAYTISVVVPATTPTTSSPPTSSVPTTSISSSTTQVAPTTSSTQVGSSGPSTSMVSSGSVTESLLQSLTAKELVSPAPKPGETFTAASDGFTPGDTVALYVASTPQLLGSAVAGSNGVVSVTATLPADTTVGEHTLALLASDNVSGFAQRFAVTSTGTSGGLPITGSDARTNLAIAVALLGVGLLATFAARRRTDTAN